MSMEVELSVGDYHNIMNWYELAFAKKKPSEIDNKDHATFRKLSVMAQAFVEEQSELHKDDKDLVWRKSKMLWKEINQKIHMVIIVPIVVIMTRFILGKQIVSVFAMIQIS